MEGTDLQDGFGGYLSGLFEQMVTNLISKQGCNTLKNNKSRAVLKTSTLLNMVIYRVYGHYCVLNKQDRKVNQMSY